MLQISLYYDESAYKNANICYPLALLKCLLSGKNVIRTVLLSIWDKFPKSWHLYLNL